MHLWGKCLSLLAAVVAITVVHGVTDRAAARTLCIGKESVLLRAGPSWRQDPVGSLPAGTCGIEVVGKCASGWCEVAHGNRRGWVDSRLVNVHESGSAPAPQKKVEPPPPRQQQAAPSPAEPPPRATAATPDRDSHCVMGVRPGDTLRIRSGPGVEHREVGEIPPNACGVIIAGPCQGPWCPVTYRGVRGWSNASYLRPPWMR